MIAVILMVAITVVLAAVVYVFVSGFSGESTTPRTLGLTSNGPTIDQNATYTITTASPDLMWDEVVFQIAGDALDHANLSASYAPGSWCLFKNGYCASTPSGYVGAGDQVKLQYPSISGKKLTVIDAPANAVILTLTVR